MLPDSDFNLYQKWFGIPADQHPPDFYQLLGLERFEADVSRIDDATEQRATFLQAITDGPNIGQAQLILNQVAAARVCLTDPKSKQEYDSALKQHLESPGQSQPFEFDVEIHSRPRKRVARKQFAMDRKLLVMIIVAGAIIFSIAVVGPVLFFLLSRPSVENPTVERTPAEPRVAKRVQRVVSKAQTQKTPETPDGMGPLVKEFLKQIEDYDSYTEVLGLDLGKLEKEIVYDFDSRDQVESFDRIAYLLELHRKQGGTPQLLFVSMDPFTDDISKIGIPTASSGANFQQKLKSVNIYSNVDGVVPGNKIETGNIEFWSYSYGPNNHKRIAGASNSARDFGDTPDPSEKDGYGSMQIHNFGEQQTLFAINHWSEGGSADIGIGNSSNGTSPDWTFAQNAGEYRRKVLRVYVRKKQ